MGSATETIDTPDWFEETYADFASCNEDVDRSPDPEAVADFEAFMGADIPAPPVEIVPARSAVLKKRKAVQEQIQSLTDEVLAESMSSIHAAQRWHELDPAQNEPPPEWVTELGEKEALRQFRIAKEAQQPSRYVAYGLKMSVDVASGIMKARGKEEPAHQLNVQVIQIQQPVFNYPSKRVDR